MTLRLWVVESGLALTGLALSFAGHNEWALLAPLAMILAALALPIMDALLGDADPGEASPKKVPKLSPQVAEALAQIDAALAQQRAGVRPTPDPSPPLLELLMARGSELLTEQMRGLSAERAGDWARAEAGFRKALEIAPGWADAQHGLMRAAFEQGQGPQLLELCPLLQGQGPGFLEPVGADEFRAWSADEQSAHSAHFQQVIESQMAMAAVVQLEESRERFLAAFDTKPNKSR